jgi:hypothetical protein
VIPIKSIPKILLATIIGVSLFMGIMPDKIGKMPESVFFLIFGGSLLVGWLAATGVFRLARWLLSHQRGNQQ